MVGAGGVRDCGSDNLFDGRGRASNTHPPRRRRAVDPDAADVSAAPGRLRGRAGSTGAEALERFAESEFDLVVLDVMMPNVDGLEVCRRMRASSAVPIIMLTAKTEEIDKVLGLELGADDYITKPFSIREFRAA